MTFVRDMLSRPRPPRIRHDVQLPRRVAYYPSPVDWRDEVIYFLMVDRFSDGQEDTRPLLDRRYLAAARPALPNGDPWRWDRWALSGGERFQGGTLRGIISKLGYLQRLGITTLWLSPVCKQRVHLDTYHGYAIQDFLDVDPRFGTRQDLVDLVSAAHERGMRVLLDIVFQHTGPNWRYPPDVPGGADMPHYTSGRYPFGSWVDAAGAPLVGVPDVNDAAWPEEMRTIDYYTRAGAGDLGAGAIDDPAAEHKRSDFFTLRDINLDAPGALTDLALCYKYWIALTDCDGFRIDTLKHVSFEQARNFCGTIKEFAANLGKANFFLVGEVAGGDFAATRYLDALERNLNAALDIGEMRLALGDVAKGLAPARAYFDGFVPGLAIMGSHRNLGSRHISILDDHDHVFGTKLRFSTDVMSQHHAAAAVALQLFTLGIPCIYYGTEQALGGPEPSERQWLPEWGRADRYLREAMFGPLHPRASGRAGIDPQALDTSLPGFGPFGTAGHHCFDERFPVYMRIAALAALRAAFPVLRHGRQYLRPISNFNQPFAFPPAGEIVAWSRILDDEEALCVINPNGLAARGGDVVIDAALNRPGDTMTVILNTAQAADPDGYDGLYPKGRQLTVKERNGTSYVEIRNLPPAETLVLTNRP